MRTSRRIVGAWAAILGIAALALTSVQQPVKSTEATWADSEHAVAALHHVGEPDVPDEPEEPTDPDPGDDDDEEPGISTKVTLTEGSVTQSTGQVDFCYSFKLRNDTAETVEWEYTFDTSKAPFWGWTPYDSAGTPRFNTHADYRLGAWTGEFDASSSLWTIRGKDFQNELGDTRFIKPDNYRSLRFCTNDGTAPYPEVDPTLFTWDLNTNNQGWGVTLGVTIETESETHIPWGITVDLNEIFCPDVLNDVQIEWWYGYVPTADESGHIFRYYPPRGHWDVLINKETSYDKVIANLKLDRPHIRDHLVPNC